MNKYKIQVYILFFYTIVACSFESKNTDIVEFCNKHRANQRIILVSTLDGKLSALNVDDGLELWSIATKPGPLLSSTIHTMEVAEKHQIVRIIPSLSGGLYKFDGESIEPMPINTDTLLQTNWDDVDISGGREIRSYAVDIESGNIMYECSMNECSNRTDTAYLSDMLLLRRETQKVRALDLQTRAERWNYSVGLHNLTLVHNALPECVNQLKPLNLLIKAIVPKGLLFVSNKSKPEGIQWKHEFDSPIVYVWTLFTGKLEMVNLFKPVQSVAKKQKIFPTLYIGVHDEQLYIQESGPIQRKQSFYDKPRLSMKKYHLIQAYGKASL